VGMHGAPRLVSLSHRAILNTLLSVRDTVGLKASHRCLVSSAASAESALLEWLLPWTAGATSVAAKAEAATDMGALQREIASAQATFFNLPTESWQALFNAGWRPEAGSIGLLGGEKPALELAEQIAQTSGSFWRVWGCAETGVWTTLNAIEQPEDALLAGRPIDNMQVRVLDEQGRPRAVGVWGEVWVSGASLAEGYIAEPLLTTERFRERCFILGERGRWRSDGRIELQSGDARALTVGNTRIDMAALSAFIRKQDAVNDAACVVRSGNDGRSRVVAYVAAADADVRTRLRQVLADRVPPVAGPAEVVVLAELPRLPDGRIDARSLPSPEDHAGQANANSFVEPQTETEKALAAIWCDLLGLPRVSSRDNFFDLGGHSLLAMQAITKMEQKTGKQVAARRYMFQTLAQLASSYEEPVAAAAPQKKGLMGRLLGALRGAGSS
jgi:acyl-coenzyme A synthetase/AMP-(fatty) acid ligase